MKSILHDKEDRTCFLCMILEKDYSEKAVLHEHHCIFGTAGRKMSEKYGLKVYLCVRHHETGKESVHQNAENANLLKAAAEITFIKRYSEQQFRQVFGRSYLADLPEKYQAGALLQKESPSTAAGFRRTDTGLDGMDW